MTLDELKRNDKISFDVYPEGMIESDFNNVTYLGTVSRDIVVDSGYDADAVFVRCYPTLPDNNYQLNAGAYDWIIVRNENNGKKAYVCSLWIKPETLLKVTKSYVTLKIYNQTDTATVTAVSNALRDLGVEDFEIVNGG